MSKMIDYFNDGVDFDSLYSPDVALRFCVLTILSKAVGHENRLRGDQFIAQVKNLWYWKIDKENKPPDGRKIRDTLCQLRQEGALVVSTGGTKGGYWIPDSFEEIKVFVNVEFRKKSLSMLYTGKQQLDAGRRKFGGQATIWHQASGLSRQYQHAITLLED